MQGCWKSRTDWLTHLINNYEGGLLRMPAGKDGLPHVFEDGQGTGGLPVMQDKAQQVGRPVSLHRRDAVRLHEAPARNPSPVQQVGLVRSPGFLAALADLQPHYEVCKYCQSTSRVQASVLQNLRVSHQAPGCAHRAH